MKKRTKLYITAGAIVLFLIAWSVLLYNYPPKDIVESIGIQNGYLVAFLVATIGGVTSITGSSYYVVIATLASGGLNPLLLGITAGIGVAISDSIFFWIGKKSRNLISEDKKQKANKLSRKIENKPKWLIPIITYLYIGLTPLPNDILTIALGLMDVKYKTIVIPIILGSITATTIFAYLGSSILGLFF